MPYLLDTNVCVMYLNGEMFLRNYQYYRFEDYYLAWKVERAIAQSECYERNVSLAKETGQVEFSLWAGAERIVLENF
jgi:hypothetical protein